MLRSVFVRESDQAVLRPTYSDDVAPRAPYIRSCKPEVSLRENPPGSNSETHTLCGFSCNKGGTL